MRLFEIEDKDHLLHILFNNFEVTSNAKVTVANGLINIDKNCKLGTINDKLPVKFGIVKGNFLCDGGQLISLEGAPKKVGGNFWCSGNRLTTLQGAPQEVGGNFYCYNNRLTTLQGAPDLHNKEFDCGGNLLTTLQGAPQKVNRFNCGSNQLISLEGGPKIVDGDFSCHNNPLTSLQGLPQKIGNMFMCNYKENLPLLRLLNVQDLQEIVILDDNHLVMDSISSILNKYLKTRQPISQIVINKYLNTSLKHNNGNILKCASELSKAGFKGNARL